MDPPKPNWEPFSEEIYKSAVENKEELIILVNSESFIDSFQKDVDDYLFNLGLMTENIRKNKRKIRFFKLSLTSKEQIADFEKKFNVRLGRDVLLLLKNRYFQNFISFSVSQFFNQKEYLIQAFEKIKKIKSANFAQFLESAKQLPKDSVVVLSYAPKDSAEFPALKQKFAKLSLEHNYSGLKNIYFLLIKDVEGKKGLKLEQAEEGDIFLFQRKSKLNFGRKNIDYDNNGFYAEKAGSLKGKLGDIMEEISKCYGRTNIFSARGFEQALPPKFSLVIEMDMNKMDKTTYNRAIGLMGDLRKELSEKKPELYEKIAFVKNMKSLEKQSLSIFIRDDQSLFESIMEKDLKSLEELKALYKDKVIPDVNKPNSFTYRFPNEERLTKENLIKFIENIEKGQIPQYFKTQKPPKYRRYSKKIVGKTFKKEILQAPKAQALFLYSKHCHACKRYGSFYENFALESLKKEGNGQIEYNRINSDENEIDLMKKFHYTPVFMVFFKEFKKRPCVYASDKMTPELLKNFIEVAGGYEVMDEKSFGKVIGKSE